MTWETWLLADSARPDHAQAQFCSACVSALQRNNKLGALAFGVELPNGKQAFPTSPSWILYGGDDAHCMDNVPVLIRPETFCSVFTAEARVFRQGPEFSKSRMQPMPFMQS